MATTWESVFNDYVIPIAAAGIGLAAGGPGGAIAGYALGVGLSGVNRAPGDIPVREPSLRPEEAAFYQERQEALRQLLGAIPTTEERYETARGGIAQEASQAKGVLLANAAQRGLLHSGILQAERAKLDLAARQRLAGAATQAELGPQLDRARILGLVAADQPLPEVTIRQGPTGTAPLLLGGLGAVAGGVLGGTGGAALGYGVGSSLGQAAQAGGEATPVARRRMY